MARSEPFSPPDRLARWTEGLLTASMALAVAGVATALLAMTGSGEPVSDGQLDLKQAAQALVAGLQLLVLIGAAVAFPMWFYRAHKKSACSSRHQPGVQPCLGCRWILRTVSESRATHAGDARGVVLE